MKSIIAGPSQSSALSPLVCLLVTNDSPNSSLMKLYVLLVMQV